MSTPRSRRTRVERSSCPRGGRGGGGGGGGGAGITPLWFNPDGSPRGLSGRIQCEEHCTGAAQLEHVGDLFYDEPGPGDEEEEGGVRDGYRSTRGELAHHRGPRDPHIPCHVQERAQEW
jgi:hypothetical protein